MVIECILCRVNEKWSTVQPTLTSVVLIEESLYDSVELHEKSQWVQLLFVYNEGHLKIKQITVMTYRQDTSGTWIKL